MRWKLNAITERGKELWTYTKQKLREDLEDIGALGIRAEKHAEIGPTLQQRSGPTGP